MTTPITPQGLPPLPKPTAWMMTWAQHSPSFTVDKSDYVSWFGGTASYPDDLHDLFTAEQMQAYAREALRTQALTAPNLACKSAQARLATQWGYVRAASVEPVASVLYLSDTGLCSEISEELPWGMALYAGAPPAPASVQNASLVEKLAMAIEAQAKETRQEARHGMLQEISRIEP